jgi:hypothetical protein
VEAFPAPPDGVGLPAGAGVEDPVLGAVAIRAAHLKNGFRFSVKKQKSPSPRISIGIYNRFPEKG